MALLSYGSNGDAVKTLQQNLNTVGNYGLDVDGAYGAKTQAAVTDYQKKNNLAVDGIVGDETNGSLAKALAAAQAKQAGSTTASATVTTKTTTPAAQAPELKYAEKAPDLTPYLDQWRQTAEEQAQKKVDFATQQGITELERAQEDAQPMFQTQRNQIDIDEAKALSNQALYAEARGDKGGIGAAQYAAIQNTAAKNRLTVSQSQTKLATDTARQISDLRAQGEFQKADSLLEISQNYLTQLMQLQQWALSYNMSVDEFNNEVEKWKANYEMQVSEITGMFRGQQTFAAKKAEESKLADAGSSLLDAGIMPSAAQLAAMGMDKSQAQSYINAVKAAQAAASSGGSGGGGGSRSSGTNSNYDPEVAALQKELNDKYGAGLDVDGVKGPLTIAAIEKYMSGGTNITNRHDESGDKRWITVKDSSGRNSGRYTYQELINMVNSGKVKETYNSKNNTYTYTWAK